MFMFSCQKNGLVHYHETCGLYTMPEGNGFIAARNYVEGKVIGMFEGYGETRVDAIKDYQNQFFTMLR